MRRVLFFFCLVRFHFVVAVLTSIHSCAFVILSKSTASFNLFVFIICTHIGVCFIYLDCILLKIGENMQLLWKSAKKSRVYSSATIFIVFTELAPVLEVTESTWSYWICGKVKWYDAQAIVNTFFGQIVIDDDDRNFCILISSTAYGTSG